MSRPGEPIEALPTDGGAYVFVMHCGRPFSARIGALGELHFEPGYYCYAGSARNGLRARVSRHLRREGKRLHWHVDYLRPHGRPVGVLVWRGGAADECALNRLLANRAQGAVAGFGCSDCSCGSHLHFTREHPAALLSAAAPDGARWISLEAEGTQCPQPAAHPPHVLPVPAASHGRQHSATRMDAQPRKKRNELSYPFTAPI